MKYWTVYNDEGRITGLMAGTEPIDEELNGSSYIPGRWSSSKYYVNDSVAVFRPEMNILSPLSVSINEEAIILNIPSQCVVSHPDGVNVIDDEQIEWQSAVAGTFLFSFERFPYISEEIQIEVTP